MKRYLVLLNTHLPHKPQLRLFLGLQSASVDNFDIVLKIRKGDGFLSSDTLPATAKKHYNGLNQTKRNKHTLCCLHSSINI